MKKPGKASLIIAIGNLLAFGGGYARAAGEAAFHPVFAQGEWWRLLTCGYLHLGAFHLLANLPPLLIAGSKAEDYLGRSRFLFLYHMGTAITAFLFCLSFQNASMVGASLGIYAVLGCCVALHRWNPSLESLRFSKAQKNYLIGLYGPWQSAGCSYDRCTSDRIYHRNFVWLCLAEP